MRLAKKRSVKNLFKKTYITKLNGAKYDHQYISDLWLKYFEFTINGLQKIDDNMCCNFWRAMLYIFLSLKGI
jgi:hypothetical protein